MTNSLILVLLPLLISITTTEVIISDNKKGRITFRSAAQIKSGEEEEIKIMTTSESKSKSSSASTDNADNADNDNNADNYENEINKELDDMSLLPITSNDTVRACRMLNINPSHDIFICSYPKR
jgi:hypothetical protein